MRVFKIKKFARFQRQERLTDEALTDAVIRAESGLIDADLGGGLLKQRVARRGRGRSGGYRTILAYRQGDRAVFLFGFAKNDQENIGGDELSVLREFGRYWLSLDDETIFVAETEGRLMEIEYDSDDPESS